MCVQKKSAICLFLSVILACSLHKVRARNLIREALVQVPFGQTVTLVCESNDQNHTFFYWYLNERDVIIGPSNDYDNGKFRYEVLSGNLTVKAVSKEEEGVYNCVSRGVKTDDVNIRSVRMVVQADWEEVLEDDPDEVVTGEDKSTSLVDRISGVVFGVALPKLGKVFGMIREKGQEMRSFVEEQGGSEEMRRHCPLTGGSGDFQQRLHALKVNLFRVAVVLGSLVVLSGVGYAGYKIWKTRYRHPSYLIHSEDEEEEDSGEELFRAPGTSGTSNSIVKNNSTDSFETPGISTDFRSILDTANKK